MHDKPIEDFWVWWADVGRAAAEAGMRDCAFGALDYEMNARVEAMHADLAWELVPGRQAEHALVVTAAGVPGRRRIAERWFREAPPADEIWEYHPARQASLSPQMVMADLNGWKLDLRKLRFGLHVDGDLLDTVVFHPRFAAMPPAACEHMGFLALDWAPGAFDRLRGFEDRLTGWLPPYVRLLAHETIRGTRTFHLYGDSDDPTLIQQVLALAEEWPSATVRPALDAGWRAIRHLMG